MKILHISKNWFDTKVYNNLYNHLKKFVDQHVYAIVASDRNIETTNENIKILKCIYTKLYGLYKLKIFLIYIHILNNIDIYFNYKLVHAHFIFFDGDIAYRIFKKFHVPYIVTVRTSDIYIFDKRFYLRRRGFRILNNASKIVFISYAHKNYFFNHYLSKSKYKNKIISKSIIIPNGIDNFWHENRKFQQKKDIISNYEILTVAGIDSNKNHILVVEAIIELQKLGVKCHYTIIGEIIDKSIFKKLLKYSFVDHVKPVSNDILINYYRNADVFVMPSHSETFGLVYLEAISQGLPVIYTKNQGIDGFFEDGVVGYSVNSNDKIELSQAILKIIKDSDRFDFNRIDLENFKWDKIANKYFQLYKSI